MSDPIQAKLEGDETARFPKDTTQRRGLIHAAFAGIFFGVLPALTGWLTCGPTLGAIIAIFTGCTLAMPVFITGFKKISQVGAFILCLFLPGAAALLALPAPISQRVLVILVLASWIVGWAGLASLLARAIAPWLAAAIVSILALAWMLAPIWADPAIGLPNRSLQQIVSLNPILLSNGILTFTPPWTEGAIAYQLTTLNQDVPIALPTNPLPLMGIQCLLGLGWLVNLFKSRIA